jgi:hypothetical protein
VGESTNSYRKRVYGVDDKWVETQLVVQGEVCAVCRKPNPSRGGEEPKKLGIDHDHYSGRTRGLLCENCNLILGRVEGKSGCPLAESAEYLTRMIIYLREHHFGTAIPFSPIGAGQPEMLPESEPSSLCEQGDSISVPSEAGTGEPQKVSTS